MPSSFWSVAQLGSGPARDADLDGCFDNLGDLFADVLRVKALQLLFRGLCQDP